MKLRKGLRRGSVLPVNVVVWGRVGSCGVVKKRFYKHNIPNDHKFYKMKYDNSVSSIH